MLARAKERATSTVATTLKCNSCCCNCCWCYYLTLHFVCLRNCCCLYCMLQWALFAYFTAKMKLKSTRAFLMLVYMFYPSAFSSEQQHVLAFTASKFFPRLAIFLLKWAKILYIQCLQSFPFSVAILLHCHCESVLHASCPGPIAIQIPIPIPNAARQLARLLLRLESVCQLVSKSSGRWDGGGRGKGQDRRGSCCSLAVGLPLLLLLIYFDLFTIAIYISSFFRTLCSPSPLLLLLSSLCISLLLLFQSRK